MQELCPGFTLTEFRDAPQYAQYHVKERIPGWLWMTPEAVVKTSLQALKGTALLDQAGFALRSFTA